MNLKVGFGENKTTFLVGFGENKTTMPVSYTEEIVMLEGSATTETVERVLLELANGIVFKDRTTGKHYTVYVDSGKLMLAESEG